jgi:hypothetical protein
MNKTIAITAIVMFAVIIGMSAMSPALAAGKAAPKATGDIGYVIGFQRYAVFDAQMAVYDRPVKGTFQYSDVIGQWYTVNLSCVSVTDNTASFGGQVVAGNILLDSWISIGVKDIGTPGSQGDLVYGAVTDDSTVSNCASINITTLSDAFDVTSGNLQVFPPL